MALVDKINVWFWRLYNPVFGRLIGHYASIVYNSGGSRGEPPRYESDRKTSSKIPISSVFAVKCNKNHTHFNVIHGNPSVAHDATSWSLSLLLHAWFRFSSSNQMEYQTGQMDIVFSWSHSTTSIQHWASSLLGHHPFRLDSSGRSFLRLYYLLSLTLGLNSPLSKSQTCTKCNRLALHLNLNSHWISNQRTKRRNLNEYIFAPSNKTTLKLPTAPFLPLILFHSDTQLCAHLAVTSQFICYFHFSGEALPISNGIVWWEC